MERRLRFAFFLIAAALSPCANAALRIEMVSNVVRPSSSTYVAEQLSGITWAGGDLYYAVDDNDNKLYPLTLQIDPDGSLAVANIQIGAGVTMTNSHDMEGCAFDPASGNIWISQETSALIREFNPATGELLRSAPVPEILKRYRNNFSLEALTISGDGMTMWTANEEALYPDGNNSTKTEGTIVRLARFSRECVYDGWTADGQWAYQTDSGYPFDMEGVSNARCGVSALTLLPDGTLLVLERGYGRWGSLADDFKNYIYAVDFSAATDVSSISALTNATYVSVGKTSVWGDNTFKLVNYEGMCLGPRLSDGSVSLVIIADGGGGGNNKIMTLKLSGIDVRTLDIEKPEMGEYSLAGGPYRYVTGQTVEVSLSGVEYASVYTNNMAVCTNVAWRCGAASGSTSQASFTVSEDATFAWSLTPCEAATSAIDFAENFEGYREGASLGDGEVGRWNGTGEIVAGGSQFIAGDSPMARDAHTKVLEIDLSASCDFPCTTNGNDMVEMMVSVTRLQQDDDDNKISDDALCALKCDENGIMRLKIGDEWVALSDNVYENGDWVRFSFKLATNSAGETFIQPRIDGEACKTDAGVHSPEKTVSPGAWYPVMNPGYVISGIDIHGSVKLDDIIKTVEGYEPEIPAGTSYIDGVSVAWLRENGMGLDPNVPAALKRLASLGYTVGDVYFAGLDPEKDEPFNFTGIRLTEDDHLELTFNGIARTRDSYGVYRMETIGGEETPVAGSVEVDEANYTTTWTSIEPIDATRGFYITRIDNN